MATRKATRVAEGRAIRQATGLPLPIAMTIAKRLDQNNPSQEGLNKIRPYIDVRVNPPVVVGGYVEYEASWEAHIVGPKGTYDYGYSSAISRLLR